MHAWQCKVDCLLAYFRNIFRVYQITVIFKIISLYETNIYLGEYTFYDNCQGESTLTKTLHIVYVREILIQSNLPGTHYRAYVF